MLTHVDVLPPAQYDHFVKQRATDRVGLGKDEFEGVCATCHGLAGQGGYGPNIASNPVLADRAGLTKLLRNGGIKMPAVGDDWSDSQINALFIYVKERFKLGGSGGR
jgi:mono/diheme cytochrome c family protein